MSLKFILDVQFIFESCSYQSKNMKENISVVLFVDTTSIIALMCHHRVRSLAKWVLSGHPCGDTSNPVLLGIPVMTPTTVYKPNISVDLGIDLGESQDH